MRVIFVGLARERKLTIIPESTDGLQQSWLERMSRRRERGISDLVPQEVGISVKAEDAFSLWCFYTCKVDFLNMQITRIDLDCLCLEAPLDSGAY